MGQWVGPGINDVDSYQLPGVPHITTLGASSSKTINYKLVTTQVIFSVMGTGTGLTIDFQDSVTPSKPGPAVDTSKTMVLPAGVHTFNVRTDRLKITTPANITAGVCALLSPVEAKHFTPADMDDLVYGA